MASAGLAFMPGPDNIYVLTESVSKGPRQGIFITAGLVSGVLVHTTLVATGLSLIVFKNDLAYNILKYAGAIYLIYLAYGAWKEEPKPLEIRIGGQQDAFFRLYRKGFLMNVLNPKVTVFFIAFLPQFVASDGWSPMLQLIILGVVFMLVSFIIFSSIALVSGESVKFVKNKKFWVVTKFFKISILLALAILLAYSHR